MIKIKIFIAIKLVLVLLSLVGWCKCVYKATQCDWSPIGKAEVFYTIGSVTGAGAIIGWFDIEDKK